MYLLRIFLNPTPSRQINAEVKRTTMIMDKIHEYRKNSLTKKEKRGRDARKHFKQDGDLLRSVKRELAQDKKKRIEAKVSPISGN